MEKVITLLSEIEEKAARIIEGATKEKTNLHDKFEEDIKRLDITIKNDTDKKLDELKKNMNQSLENEKKKLMDDRDMQLSKLEYEFTQNHNALIDKVFGDIIGA